MAITPDQGMISALDSGTFIMGLKIGRVRWKIQLASRQASRVNHGKEQCQQREREVTYQGHVLVIADLEN